MADLRQTADGLEPVETCCIDMAGKRYMGRKDTAGRIFFSDKERFAELMNVHLYGGNQAVSGKHLVQRNREYLPLSGVYGEKQRDILMEDRSRNLCFGMELETESDYSMPERIMVYDACEYEYQVREIYGRHRRQGDFKNYREKKSRVQKADNLHPIVNIVLYLGEGHWEGRKHLTELFRFSEKDGKNLCVQLYDYSFVLLEADYVEPEDYETDLRQFFQAMQSRRDRKKLRNLLKSEEFMHLGPETELAIAAHLHVEKLFHRMTKEGISMCKAFDELMKEERLIGKKEGKQEGKREGEKAGKKKERFMIIRKMYKKGLEETLIRELTGCTGKEFAAAIGK